MEFRLMRQEDLDGVAEVHRKAFTRQTMSTEWIECNFRAFPRMLYYVAEEDSAILGFIHWTQRSGFRPQVVLELEQLAVDPERHGQGIGTALIRQSLDQVKEHLRTRDAIVKHIVVTTRIDNAAQRLYRKTLGVEVEATIRDLYSADEVFMVARNIEETGA